MALEVNLPADLIGIAEEQKFLHLGDDLTIRFQIGDDDATLETIEAGTATMVDVSGFALEFVVRASDTTTAAALLTKTTSSGITISGVYNATASINTQKVIVTLADTDIPVYDATTGLGFKDKSKKVYRYALKRTDAGNEKTLAFGDLAFTETPSR